MTEQQANLFKLFKEIDAVCKKNNIEYTLAGGSAIGPVRHHGFIPWDDDMDIFMTRDNWMKFIEASKTDLPEGRCVLAQELDHNYTNMFGRYCDKTATAIHRHAMYSTEQSGEIIDIFVLDPVISAPEQFNEYVQNVVLYSELVNKTAPLYGYRFDVPAGRYLRYWFLSKIIGRNRVLDMLQKKMFKYPVEECDAYAMRWGGCPFLFPKEWFEKVRTCYMEDGEYPIIYMNNAFLTWHYGDDWIYIPPVSEQKSHDTVSRLDMGSDEFRKHCEPFVHAGRKRFWLELLGTYRKAYYMRKAKKRERIAMGILKDKAELISLDLKKRLEAININDIEKMARARRFDELMEVFGPYMRFQLSRECIGGHDFGDMLRYRKPCFVPVNDKVLHGFLMMLLYNNKVGKAVRLLEVRKLQPEYNEKTFEDIEYFIKKFRDSVNCYDIGKCEEGYELIKELFAKYPDNPMLMKLVIRYAFYKKQGSVEEAAKLVHKGQELCPEDGEFLYYDVRFVRQEKDPDKLKEEFEQVRSMTTNGMVLLEIEEYDYGCDSE